jgi:predicted helicase
MSQEFASFLPLGSKQGEAETVFTRTSYGIPTNRDDWVTGNANRGSCIEVQNPHMILKPILKTLCTQKP